jgi:glutamyl-tRNA synthetase
VKPNLTRMADVIEMWRMVQGPVVPVVENRELLQRASELLPPEPWGENVWQQWTKALGESTGVKGRALFHPLRLALTGCEHGPELKKLLPLIGRARALARLNGEAA